MGELKTKKTGASVAQFLDSISDLQKREDCRAIAAMMRAATKAEGRMWGPSIVGFGHRLLVYPNGKVMDWMKVAFSPRKANITLYLTQEVLQSGLVSKLGKSACGRGCLYLKRLSDVDRPTLGRLIRATVRQK